MYYTNTKYKYKNVVYKSNKFCLFFFLFFSLVCKATAKIMQASIRLFFPFPCFFLFFFPDVNKLKIDRKERTKESTPGRMNTQLTTTVNGEIMCAQAEDQK